MSHPYTEHEDRALWDAAYAALNDLERRGDIALRTSRAYVVGHLCQRPTHPDVVVPARAPGVPVVFSADEALVLPDLLARLSDDGQLHAEHAAELRVSWDLDCRLERRLAEPFSPQCSELVAAARARIAGPREWDGRRRTGGRTNRRSRRGGPAIRARDGPVRAASQPDSGVAPRRAPTG